MCSLYKTLVFLFSFNLAACGAGSSGGGEAVSNPDAGSSSGTPEASYPKDSDSSAGAGGGESDSSGAPVYQGKSSFDQAFSSSVLQYEVTDGTKQKTLYSEELLEYPETDYFYFKNAYLVFDLIREGKAKKRSELRQYPEWSIGDENTMTATLRLESSELNEYTWMQLHRKEKYSVKPPLRLTWAKAQRIDGKTYKDYLVAVFYHEGSGYHKVPLMPRPDGDFKAQVRANNHQVFISVNDSLMHVENVAGWANYNCYFKVGLYLSGSESAYGNTQVAVSALDFQHSPSISGKY
ncbi:polysaccharide lyase family 7 protein [Alcanivorax sp. DP30]|uniref:polysaccharide lyase family 7 protein n=1 Tax=Alcanivorax sp. DP30 TaxID=2606217 RepID=UPI00136ACE7D|nr:polysaccharide lyase family 7 protein [Alcanivorax sp. DP30]MZR61446.1 hypothetical protein [Alcanivorax sp. DP30]